MAFKSIKMESTEDKYESEIQAAILDYLKIIGVVAWRNYMGGVVRHVGKKIVLTPNPNKGLPDVQGILPGTNGRSFFIEVKSKDGRLKKEQIEWIEKLEKAGAKVIVARTLEKVMKEFAKMKANGYKL